MNLYGFGSNELVNGYDDLGEIWHHIVTFAAGLDAGLSPEFINGKINGWDMDEDSHKALHKAGWTKVWNEFFRKKCTDGNLVTEGEALAFLRQLKRIHDLSLFWIKDLQLK